MNFKLLFDCAALAIIKYIKLSILAHGEQLNERMKFNHFGIVMIINQLMVHIEGRSSVILNSSVKIQGPKKLLMICH